MIRRGIWLGLLTVAFWLGAHSASGQEYVRIEAEITRANQGNSGTNVSGWVIPVTCVVGTNEWRIECDYPIDGRQSCYYDGTNLYSRLQQVRNSRLRSFGPQQKTTTNAIRVCTVEPLEDGATVTITASPGGLPVDDLGINLPWLAFCSGSYLKREGRVLAFPLDHVAITPDSFAYTDLTETFQDAFGLPRRVELFTSRTQLVSSLSDKRLYQRKRLQRLKEMLPYAQLPADGTLRFRYVVNASTNFLGWTIPTEFSFESYKLENGGASRSIGGTGKVLSISAAAKPGNVFQASTNQTISDTRFRHETKNVDAIIYQWTNVHVPSVDDPRLQAVYRETLRTADAQVPVSRSWVRQAFRVSLLLSPAIFVGIYYVVSRRA